MYSPYRVNMKELNLKNIIEGSNFFFDYIVRHMLLEGKIENWVVVMDMNKMGVMEMPYSVIKELNQHLQSNFRNRMFVLYLINAPSMISIPWKVCKGFLDESTVKKIHIQSDKDMSKLFTHTNKSQVESRFGGTAPNVIHFWPPKCPSSEFFVSSENPEEFIDSSYFQLKKRQSEEIDFEEFGIEICSDLNKFDSPFAVMQKCLGFLD